MKIQYASDLHLEFRDNATYIAEKPLYITGDILILTGDIIQFGKHRMENNPFFDWCSENYRQTYIIPGNHEYYQGTELTNTLFRYEYFIRDNVRYVNNKSVVIGNTEIFFTTLWSPIKDEEIIPIQMGLTDCQRIIYKGRRFTSKDYNDVYSVCFNWLSKTLSLSTTKVKVVATHHCPTLRFKDPRFIVSNINSAFCVDLDEFIKKSNIDYWIFGHTHFNGGRGEIVGKTRMLCNQLGYVKYGEMKDFENNSYIVIE